MNSQKITIVILGVLSAGMNNLDCYAHRGDGKRFVVRADEKLTAFVERESATRPRCEPS